MKIHVIRTDGTEEDHVSTEAHYREYIEKTISADCLDSVNIFKNPANRGMFGMRMPVMILDDHGYDVEPIRARKPANAKATALYHSVCIPGTTHEIVGDVAIIDDEDLA